MVNGRRPAITLPLGVTAAVLTVLLLLHHPVFICCFVGWLEEDEGTWAFKVFGRRLRGYTTHGVGEAWM